MKRGLFLLILIILLTHNSCQNTETIKVPQSVAANFIAKYPVIKYPEWVIDQSGYWEARFMLDGNRYRADFQRNGLWIQTENSVKISDLPIEIRHIIDNRFPSSKIVRVTRILHHDKGLSYRIERMDDQTLVIENYPVDGATVFP